MEQIELYKDFRIRAYEDWSGQSLAEAKKPFDTNAPNAKSRYCFHKADDR
jgi:hypothetical protein